MKVRIEFDTMELPGKAKIFHDDVQQEELFNVFLFLTPNELPTYSLNMPLFFQDIVIVGLKQAIEKALDQLKEAKSAE